jgi:hypothetical protein
MQFLRSFFIVKASTCNLFLMIRNSDTVSVFSGMKCLECGSYNTVREKGPLVRREGSAAAAGASGEEEEEEEDDEEEEEEEEQEEEQVQAKKK